MNTTCPFCQKKKDPCAFCEKPGLPILPLRYAVARADRGSAPRLSSPFGPGVEAIVLPVKDAHYTLRLLRPGYLYVFNEKRGTWQGFVVTAESYLYEFDPKRTKTPPDVAQVKFACNREGDAFLARCVNIPDADAAGKVWLGFSDIAWTPAVLDAHAKEDYRKAHMRCVDIAQWLAGKHQQPHTAPIGELVQRVAEFADAVVPGKTSLTQIVSQKFTQAKHYAQALTGLGAFSFSPHAFHDASAQAQDVLAMNSRACAIHKPMLAALTDPAGLAMELNQLSIQRALEWTEHPQRQWGYATATAIEGICEAVRSGAVKEESAERANQARINLTADHGPLTNPWLSDAQRATLEGMVKGAGQIDPEEARDIGTKAWSKYQEMYDEGARTSFLKQYVQQFNALEKDTIHPLDAAYLAWLKSSGFKAHFSHNGDASDIDSGIGFQRAMYACIKDATGRSAVVDYFKQCLAGDVTQPGEVILRALVFNQDAQAKQWNEAAAEKGTEKESPWLEMGEKIYSGFKDIIGKEHAGELQGALAGLSKYIYELSAPVMNLLNDALAGGTAWLTQAALPQQRLLGLMQALLSAQDPDKVLVDLRGMQTRKQAARALATALSQLAGEDEQKWRAGARAALDDMSGGQTQRYPYRGLFVVSKRDMAQLKGAGKGARVSGTLTATDGTEFEVLLKGNMRFVAGREVVAGGIGLIITGFVLTNSYAEWMKAESAGHMTKGINFAAGAVAMIGEVGQIGGGVLEKTPWGAARFANPLLRFQSWAEVATGVGKLLGVIGGVVAGVVQIYEGMKAKGAGDTVFGWGQIILGGSTAMLAIAVAAGAVSAGIGLVIVLILVAIGYVISLFKHDKLQHWLDSCYFGRHELNGEKYASLGVQNTAYGALAKGD